MLWLNMSRTNCGDEECEVDVNWKEMCNQIPLEFGSFSTKNTTHSEHHYCKQQDTAADPYSAEDPEQAKLF